MGIRLVARVVPPLVVLLLLVGCSSAVATAESKPVPSGSLETLSSSVAAQMQILIEAQRPGDKRNLWLDSDLATMRGRTGPAEAMLVAGVAGKELSLIEAGERTFAYVVDQYQNADGSFGVKAANGQGSDIETMFVASAMGTALLQAAGNDEATTRQKLIGSVIRAAEFLWRNGNASFYANGNINLGVSAVFAVAWRLSGNTIYWQRFVTAWNFALNPPGPRWAGLGLKRSQSPAGDNAFLTEKGGGEPGFDAEYTLLQIDQVVRVYLAVRDPRVQALVNLMVAKVMPLVQWSDGSIDVGGGTRHTQEVRRVRFLTSGVAVSYFSGCNGVESSYLQKQVQLMNEDFRGATGYWNPGMYYSWGLGPSSTIALLSHPPTVSACSVENLMFSE